MKPPVSFLWKSPELAGEFRTGVCLHGHTMHSEECLNFLPRYLHHVPGISQIVSYHERTVDFTNAWWTPPLSPASALQVEREQIAGLGLSPIVSLTDHDSIEACMSLQVTNDAKTVPVSVEWTVPYDRSIFHIGVHNLPAVSAREWMSVMAAHTASPDESKLPEILEGLDGVPGVLIVLNHPYWLEEGVDPADHPRALGRILFECLPWFHAFELNGTRTWSENAMVVELARTHSRPLIAGGDRHAAEPSACLNLTNARSFAEFAGEIRGGESNVVFMPHYREPMPLRILQAARDILRPYPEYPDRQFWTDRVYYRGKDGIVRPVSRIWSSVPWVLRPATFLIQFAASTSVRSALRLLLSRSAEAAE